MLQTPHHFFSPDPFERNLGRFRQTPNRPRCIRGGAVAARCVHLRLPSLPRYRQSHPARCGGWFLKDHRLGMLQTPHHFFSPDPFERNLGRFRQTPM
jgi:hypothetical protein